MGFVVEDTDFDKGCSFVDLKLGEEKVLQRRVIQVLPICFDLQILILALV